MTHILVIQHEGSVGLRRFGHWLENAGAQLTVLRPDQGDELPQGLKDYDGLIVLGGTAGPEEDHQWPWLPQVRALQQVATAEQSPNFNICLGAQLAAVAHQAEVFRRRVPQVGVAEIRRRPEAESDPVFQHLPQRATAVLWHQEQIAELPAGAVHLMDGTDAPVQAYRMGPSSWSVQFHPEPDAEQIRTWAEATADLVSRAGKTYEEVTAEFDAAADEIQRHFVPIAEAFVDYARRRAEPTMENYGRQEAASV